MLALSAAATERLHWNVSYRQFSVAACLARALWGACEGTARSNGGVCRLIRETVTSLEELEALQGPYAAVVVAAGAAAGALPEIGASCGTANDSALVNVSNIQCYHLTAEDQ